MKHYKPVALLLFFLLIKPWCWSQTAKIDALFNQLRNSSANEVRLSIILNLCEEYQSLNRDSLYTLALEARKLSLQQDDKDKTGLAAMALSDAYMQWGWTDSALAAIAPALSEEKGYSKKVYYKMQRHHGLIYANRSDHEKALSILYPALSGAEAAKDTLNMAAIINSIASINIAREMPDEAMPLIRKAASYCESNPLYKTVLAAVYTNAANAFLQKQKYDSSEFYIKRAVPLCRETENLFILASLQRINATIYTHQQKFDEAEAALKEMLAIRKITNGDGVIVEDNLEIADFYASSGQLKKAIELCTNLLYKNAADSSKEKTATVKNPKLRLEYFLALARYYKQGNSLNEYQRTLEEIIVLKDSLYLANSAGAMAEAQTKYEVQKKENTILQQEISLQRNQFLLFGSLGLLTLVMGFAYFILRDFRRKQKIKLEIAMAEERVRFSIAIQQAEEKERVRIAADLHDNIGAYASAISADVANISQTGLTGASIHLQNLRHHSQEIINSLRDTIWVLNKENITITGISDRIKNYISKLQPTYHSVQFNIEEKITNDIRINSQAALNVFRIVQESMHNSLKHSTANNILIYIESGESTMISISDDGKGINPQSQNETGNGFINMKARAKESGLGFFVNTTENAGTTIIIQFPTIK
jgi:signal transduction histidine kinase